MIYSDGVSEAVDMSGTKYGAYRDDLREFRQDGSRADDVTLFVLARN